MSHFFITFVAKHNNLDENTLHIVGDFLDVTWLSPSKAADVKIPQALGTSALAYIRQQLETKEIDVFQTAETGRRKKLLLADMDSTIVTDETLDELAAYAGLKDKIAAITARAMNGELDFHAAIRERVSLLKGLSADKLAETLSQIHLTSGAETFVKTMKQHGATCVLVSGGFTYFTESIAAQAGFDHHHGNQLGIKNNQLTGQVIDPILDKHAKLTFLNEYADKLKIDRSDALTIGDGANDLPMLQAAGLGLGFHAKPSVVAELTNMIRFNDLTAALYAQGYSDSDFA